MDQKHRWVEGRAWRFSCARCVSGSIWNVACWISKWSATQWLIRSIQQRQRTIIKVAESILKFQREFFDKGIAHLKPLILRDVADDTVCRGQESRPSRVPASRLWKG